MRDLVALRIVVVKCSEPDSIKRTPGSIHRATDPACDSEAQPRVAAVEPVIRQALREDENHFVQSQNGSESRRYGARHTQGGRSLRSRHSPNVALSKVRSPDHQPELLAMFADLIPRDRYDEGKEVIQKT